MGYGVKVARWFLAPVVGVRIPVPQPVFRRERWNCLLFLFVFRLQSLRFPSVLGHDLYIVQAPAIIHPRKMKWIQIFCKYIL